jgi:hypothetical protein
VRDLDATAQWTAGWLRARMVEEERRLAYHVLAGLDERRREHGARRAAFPGG